MLWSVTTEAGAGEAWLHLLRHLLLLGVECANVLLLKGTVVCEACLLRHKPIVALELPCLLGHVEGTIRSPLVAHIHLRLRHLLLRVHRHGGLILLYRVEEVDKVRVGTLIRLRYLGCWRR